MDKDIKKKLTRNWFINLQEMICNTIQQIEGEKIIIGDGYTDYELKKYGEASLFIQHIENINRKKLNKSADLISNSLTDSLIFLEDYYGK